MLRVLSRFRLLAALIILVVGGGELSAVLAQDRGQLRGVVTDTTGAPLEGATVLVKEENKGTSTGMDGRYKVRVPQGTYTVVFDFVGYQRVTRTVEIDRRTTLDVALEPETLSLSEVVVTDRDRGDDVRSLEMGTSRLEVANLERLPTFMGSPDVFRGLLSKPGVSSVSEGASGFNVRGGDVGQNLVLFNDTPVYFPSHVFGLFSTFNPDAVSDVTLHKSGIPIQYGGRASAVLNVEQKVGNRESYHLRGGVSPITSRLFVEGPIAEGKTSFIAGGRLSYINWLLNATENTTLEKSSASFRDMNLGIHHRLDPSDELDLRGYRAFDRSTLVDTTFTYATTNASVDWKHVFGDRLYLDAKGSIGRYRFTMEDPDPRRAFDLEAEVQTLKALGNLTWNPGGRHTVTAGITTKYHEINPGTLRPEGPASTLSRLQVEEEFGLESAAYISDRMDVTDNLAVEAGLRLSVYNQFGPTQTPVFASGEPRESDSIVDTVTTNRGEIAMTDVRLAPRVSVRYLLSESNSIKFSYDRTHQYLHLLSNSTAVAPTDVWRLSTRHREPQIGDQVSIGYFQDFPGESATTSLELFYKRTQNVPLFEPGTEPLLNTTLSTDLLEGRGRAYGVELLAKKTEGHLTGRVSYTFSRALRRAIGGTPEERINDGDWYPANHDRPHEFSTRLTYVGDDPRVQWNFRFTYRTGRAITFPSSKFVVEGIPLANVSDRNQARVPDYHRLDLSLRIDLEQREKSGFNGSWTLSVLNVYARSNVSGVFFGRDENGVPNAYSRSIFGTVLPSLTYTFEF